MRWHRICFSTTQWGTLNGDERALTPEQIKLCSLRDVPPPPQDLFVAFTQPIYGQITAKIQDSSEIFTHFP
jgi:hypothetical protein